MPCFAPFQYNDIRVGIPYRWDWIALCIFVGMISTFLKIKSITGGGNGELSRRGGRGTDGKVHQGVTLHHRHWWRKHRNSVFKKFIMYIVFIVEGEVKLIFAKLQDAPDRKAATMHDVMESWLRENIIPSWKLVGFGSDGECVVVVVSILTLQWNDLIHLEIQRGNVKEFHQNSTLFYRNKKIISTRYIYYLDYHTCPGVTAIIWFLSRDYWYRFTITANGVIAFWGSIHLNIYSESMV